MEDGVGEGPVQPPKEELELVTAQPGENEGRKRGWQWDQRGRQGLKTYRVNRTIRTQGPGEAPSETKN